MDTEPPTVYVTEPVVWEYKHLVRDLTKESVLSVEELNKLGEEGWESAGMVAHSDKAHFYFKRIKEN